MPWVTTYWKDNGDIYSIAWPQAALPYPGESMFGQVETVTRPDTSHWDHAARTYSDLQLRAEALPIGLTAGHEKPPIDPVVLEEIRLEAERIKAYQDALLAAQVQAAVDAGVT